MFNTQFLLRGDNSNSPNNHDRGYNQRVGPITEFIFFFHLQRFCIFTYQSPNNMQQYLQSIHHPMTPHHCKYVSEIMNTCLKILRALVYNPDKDNSTSQLSCQLPLHDGNAIECHNLALMRRSYLVIPRWSGYLLIITILRLTRARNGTHLTDTPVLGFHNVVCLWNGTPTVGSEHTDECTRIQIARADTTV